MHDPKLVVLDLAGTTIEDRGGIAEAFALAFATCGIPAGKSEAIFTSFEQHGADRSGLGLGLSIARRAVEAMEGSIRVTDLPGSGCVFTIELPQELAEPGKSPRVTGAHLSSASPLKGKFQ